MITIGKILGTHGIKGHAKIISFASIPEQIFEYSLFIPAKDDLKIENKSDMKLDLFNKLTIERKCNLKLNIFACKIDSINTIEECKKLQGIAIYINEKDLPNLEEDEFYNFQLEGSDVFLHEEKIGFIQNVFQKINKTFLEIKLLNCNIIHLSEFNKKNFPKHEIIEEKIRLFINPEVLQYLE